MNYVRCLNKFDCDLKCKQGRVDELLMLLILTPEIAVRTYALSIIFIPKIVLNGGIEQNL